MAAFAFAQSQSEQKRTVHVDTVAKLPNVKDRGLLPQELSPRKLHSSVPKLRRDEGHVLRVLRPAPLPVDLHVKRQPKSTASMAPKPEWCARAPVTKAARSFGAPRALPVRAQKENRYKPKVKSMVDCGRPKAMDAPRRKASRLRMLGVKQPQRPAQPYGRRAQSVQAPRTHRPVQAMRSVSAQAGEKRPVKRERKPPSVHAARDVLGCDSWLDSLDPRGRDERGSLWDPGSCLHGSVEQGRASVYGGASVEDVPVAPAPRGVGFAPAPARENAPAPAPAKQRAGTPAKQRTGTPAARRDPVTWESLKRDFEPPTTEECMLACATAEDFGGADVWIRPPTAFNDEEVRGGYGDSDDDDDVAGIVVEEAAAPPVAPADAFAARRKALSTPPPPLGAVYDDDEDDEEEEEVSFEAKRKALSTPPPPLGVQYDDDDEEEAEEEISFSAKRKALMTPPPPLGATYDDDDEDDDDEKEEASISTKKLTPEGAKVITFAQSAHAAAPPPAEPDVVSFEARRKALSIPPPPLGVRYDDEEDEEDEAEAPFDALVPAAAAPGTYDDEEFVAEAQ